VKVNDWGVLKMKIRTPVLRTNNTAVSAVRRPTSRKAREVGHPQLVSVRAIKKSGIVVVVGEVGHPPSICRLRLEGWATRLEIKVRPVEKPSGGEV
jgi:hypothetical protein